MFVHVRARDIMLSIEAIDSAGYQALPMNFDVSGNVSAVLHGVTGICRGPRTCHDNKQ